MNFKGQTARHGTEAEPAGSPQKVSRQNGPPERRSINVRTSQWPALLTRSLVCRGRLKEWLPKRRNGTLQRGQTVGPLLSMAAKKNTASTGTLNKRMPEVEGAERRWCMAVEKKQHTNRHKPRLLATAPGTLVLRGVGIQCEEASAKAL